MEEKDIILVEQLLCRATKMGRQKETNRKKQTERGRNRGSGSHSSLMSATYYTFQRVVISSNL